MSFDPDAAASQEAGIYGLPHGEAEARVVLLPVPFDATTSYRAGTHRGPEAILAASKQVELFDVDTGKPYQAGIFMRPIPAEVLAWNVEARAKAEPVIAAGGAHDDGLRAATSAVNALCARMNAWVKEQTGALLDAGKLVGVVGGDHSVPFGAIAALAERRPGFGILHLDAHADLRQAYEDFEWSHASIMWNVMERITGVAKLVQVGVRDFGEREYEYIQKHERRITTYFDQRMKAAAHEGEPWRKQCERIVAHLPQEVYLSFDIDGLDPRFCPNTGTPVPGGLDFNQVTTLLAMLVASGRRVIGFDLNEVAPPPDEGDDTALDSWDGNVGARLLYKMIGYALQT